MDLRLVVISPLVLSAALGLFLIVSIARSRHAPGARPLLALILAAWV